MTGAARAWERFWFAPTSTATLALVRIAYGSLLVVWALSLAPDLFDFFSSSGLVPERPPRAWTWSLLDLSSSPVAVAGLYVLLVAGAASLVLGFHTRLAAVVAMVALLSFQQRNPHVLNGGDKLLWVLGFYLMLAPAGAALSIDRRRRAAAGFWHFPARAPWALRLVQVQMSVVYVFAVWEKVRGTTWNEGTAVSYALRAEELTRFPMPEWLTESLLVANVLTFGTLAVELALGVLVWDRRARPWVLGAGVALHLFIELTMTVGFFSLAVLVGYLAFVPSDAAERVVLAGRSRLVALGAGVSVPVKNRKGRRPWGLPPVTPTPRTQGGSAMTTIETTTKPSPRRRTVLIGAAAVSLATLLAATPAALAVPKGPGEIGPCPQGGCGDPTDVFPGDIILPPTDPSDPTDGTGTLDITTDPTDPTDSTDPTDPTDPSDPSDPSEPSDPTDGSDPTEPTDASDATGGGGGGGGGSGGEIPVPRRIDTGAGGSAGGLGGPGVLALAGGTLALVAAAARRNATSTAQERR